MKEKKKEISLPWFLMVLILVVTGLSLVIATVVTHVTYPWNIILAVAYGVLAAVTLWLSYRAAFKNKTGAIKS